jgi:hypothetical protein
VWFLEFFNVVASSLCAPEQKHNNEFNQPYSFSGLAPAAALMYKGRQFTVVSSLQHSLHPDLQSCHTMKLTSSFLAFALAVGRLVAAAPAVDVVRMLNCLQYSD